MAALGVAVRTDGLRFAAPGSDVDAVGGPFESIGGLPDVAEQPIELDLARRTIHQVGHLPGSRTRAKAIGVLIARSEP
ncbi:hypothetical protein GCM10028857_27730 [Salinarchaeum chitinilyticum]